MTACRRRVPSPVRLRLSPGETAPWITVRRDCCGPVRPSESGDLWAGDGGVTRRVAGVLRQFREHTRCESGVKISLSRSPWRTPAVAIPGHSRGARRRPRPAPSGRRRARWPHLPPSTGIVHRYRMGGGESSGAKGADRALPSFSRWAGSRQVDDDSRGDSFPVKCVTLSPRQRAERHVFPELPTDGKAASLTAHTWRTFHEHTSPI